MEEFEPTRAMIKVLKSGFEATGPGSLAESQPLASGLVQGLFCTPFLPFLIRSSDRLFIVAVHLGAAWLLADATGSARRDRCGRDVYLPANRSATTAIYHA